MDGLTGRAAHTHSEDGGHSHVLRRVAVGAVLQLLPAAQVGRRAVQQVAVAGGQQLAHQHHKGVDPHHDQVLAGPAHVVVLGALRGGREAELWSGVSERRGELVTTQKGRGADLDEAERQEGHVVRAEQGVEENLLDSAVEVALQLLHLRADQLRRVRVCVRRAGVDGHVWRAGELLSEVLPQEEEEVARAEEGRLHELALLLLGRVVAVGGRRLALAPLLVEAAERDVHAEAAGSESRAVSLISGDYSHNKGTI